MTSRGNLLHTAQVHEFPSRQFEVIQDASSKQVLGKFSSIYFLIFLGSYEHVTLLCDVRVLLLPTVTMTAQRLAEDTQHAWSKLCVS